MATFQRNLTKRIGRPRIRAVERPPLGQRLYEERTRRGWTLDEAAEESERLGRPIKRGTIYAIEEGISGEPRRRHIMAFSLLYDIPADELASLSLLAADPPKENGRRNAPGGSRRGTATASTS